jgi:hypothetical protein
MVGITETEIKSMSPKDSVKRFLEAQNFIDAQFAIQLIDEVEKSIYSAKEFEIHNNYSWNVPVDKSVEALLKTYQQFLASLKNLYDTPYGFMSFDWRNMSTGEKAYLNLFSRFYYAKELIRDSIDRANRFKMASHPTESIPKTLYILIDEGEIGFHLQWQKEYIQKLVNVLPKVLSFENHSVELQIIFTTHSPMSLSDIPNDHILYLGNIDNKKMKSFAANVSDLLAQSFFMRDGLMGNFVKEKINETIKWLNNIDDKEKSEYHLQLIQQIDEPIVRQKLIEMYANKTGNTNESKEMMKRAIEAQIEEYKQNYGEDL